ncbi:flagellar filament capping protein FliD [Tumebacillus permanentifrigoris]|uniref:Flagellar hook-associated protein 2 n=1 Tax=Tumebacillus permanentifrigoris TaxID=378543 RepID=A0A316E046_9BACL|nr:flagellar filament capping protein FliD [Tumebacillus permanentifrigoris]PWK16170.1 flagellar hook-associated protein 2 [Tumebacillus permanentifrigoris]
MPIRISGLGTSGLDTDTLVKQLMQAKQIPIDKMVQKRTTLEWKRDAYRDMNTTLAGLRSAVDKVNLSTTLAAKKATSTDDTKVTATASSSASNGTYSLEVKQVAKAAQVTSGALGVASNTAQSITASAVEFNLTGELGTKKISIAAGSSITTTVSQINAASNQTGVKAVYDKAIDKLTLVSTSTGEASKIQLTELDNSHFLSNGLKLSVTNDTTTATADTTATVIGQDAIVNLNGTGDNKVRTNTFTLNNVSFSLKSDPAALGVPSYTTTLTVETDIDAMYNNIKTFIDKYNEVIDKLDAKVSERSYRDFPPLTDTQKKDMKDSDILAWNQKAQSGLLRNDDFLKPAMDQFRQYITTPVASIADPIYNSMTSIGITGAAVTGSNKYQYADKHLYIDEKKLREALTDEPDKVVELFTKYNTSSYDSHGVLTKSSDEGIASRLSYALKNVINRMGDRASTSPSTSPLTKQINDYNTQISTQTSKLGSYEQQYYSQFAALEKALSKMNAQGSWLMSQLGQ